MVEHIRFKFLNEWLPRLSLEPTVDVKTWKFLSPRCIVCFIGFVRFGKRERPSSANARKNRTNAYSDAAAAASMQAKQFGGGGDDEDPYRDENLCLPCVVRKELYARAQLTFPRSVRRLVQKTWPFKNTTYPSMDEVVASVDPLPQAGGGVSLPPIPSSPLSLSSGGEGMFGNSFTGPQTGMSVNMSMMTMNMSQQHPLSPVASSRLMELDAMEHGGGGGWDQADADGSASIESLGSGSASLVSELGFEGQHKGLKGKRGARAGVATPKGKSKKDAAAAAAPTLLYKGFANLSISSVSTASTDPAKDESIFGPQELTLIPFLIVKGHFEEAERTVRIALNLRSVDEGDGLMLLLRALNMQADMYKLMGLWPLALGVYLDCADLMASLAGFDALTTIAALGNVTGCLRKMHCAPLAKRYIKTLCGRLTLETLTAQNAAAARQIVEYDRLGARSSRSFIF